MNLTLSIKNVKLITMLISRRARANFSDSSKAEFNAVQCTAGTGQKLCKTWNETACT
jgi:hypothetical protein